MTTKRPVNSLLLATMISTLFLFSCADKSALTLRKGRYTHHLGLELSSLKNRSNTGESSNPAGVQALKTDKISTSSFSVQSFQDSLSISTANAEFVTPIESSEFRETSLNDDCGDIIVLKNGNEIKAKVLEITTEVVKYKRCDNLDGPLISIAKPKLFMIRYKNGTKEVFKDETPAPQETVEDRPKRKRMVAGSIVGFAIGAATIAVWLVISIYAAIPMGIAAVILGLMSFRKYKKDKDGVKRASRNFSIWSVILGLLSVALGFLGIVAFGLY